MRMLKSIAVALSVTAIAGCKVFADGDSGNGGNEPLFETPGRTDVTAQVAFPSNYLLAETLEVGQALSYVELFVGFGYSFTDPNDLSGMFQAGGVGEFTASVGNGNLMVVEAFDPVSSHFMGALTGFNVEGAPTTVGIQITPMTDAIADLVIQANPDSTDGLQDEYEVIRMNGLFENAGRSQLILEGYSIADAQNATDMQVQDALDRLLADGTQALADAETYVKTLLEGSTWSASGSSAALMFADGAVVYTDASSNQYDGTYSLVREPMTLILRMDLGAMGVQDVAIDNMISGGNALSLFGDDLVNSGIQTMSGG